MSEEQGFPDYVAQTNETGAALLAFVLVYTFMSLLMIAPLLIYGRRNDKQDLVWMLDEHQGGFSRENVTREKELEALGQQPLRPDPPLCPSDNGGPNLPEVRSEQGPVPSFIPISEGEAHSEPVLRRNSGRRVQGGILYQFNRYVSSSYPDGDPDFISSAMSSGRGSRARESVGTNDQSFTLSAATTSRLRSSCIQQRPHTRIWDVNGRRWKPRRPVGRARSMHHAIQSESRVMADISLGQPCQPSAGHASTSPIHGEAVSQAPSGGRDNMIVSQNGVRSRRQRSRRGESFSSTGSASILPPPFIIDDISPNDAADAGDPGRPRYFLPNEDEEVTVFCGPNALWRPHVLVKSIDIMADIANPEKELKRILFLGVPLTLGAISAGVFQVIILGVVSNSLGTNSMVAFLLASIFLGLSDDVIGAIADAESALCSHSFEMGDLHSTGQYIQLAACFHLIVYAAIMVVWSFYMDSVVEWLVESPEIADIALSYTRISVFQHLLQTLSRTATVLFHLVGSENFEAQTDFGEGLLSVVVVACVLPSLREATLDSVGWIQLTMALGAFVIKLFHAATRGWPPLFWKGIVGDNAFRNLKAVNQLFVSSVPLFVGAFLEFGEWEILVVFIANLGPAEVVAWALLGVIWQILVASTEGVGEAAAIRVAYHLGTGNAPMAKLTSYKSCFVALVQALFVTATLFMIGKNLSTWLTTDVTLQNMVHNSIPLVGLGNIVMNFAFICWNLIGAQGRYRLATTVILLSRWIITLPIAAVFVYGLTLDLNGIMAAVIVGFDTASMALAYVLLRSNWERLATTVQNLNEIVDDDSYYDSESDQDELANGNGCQAG